MTNLLPSFRKKLLLREYHFRLGVVILSLCIVLVFSAAVLLVPTYVFLTGDIQAKEIRLTAIKSTLSSADEKALAARLSALEKDAETLVALANKPSASSALRAALGVSRPGITLSSFSYTAPAGKNLSTLTLSGTAVTRDSLRNYQLALMNTSFAHTVELPVSAYAKDTNITFTITITLVP